MGRDSYGKSALGYRLLELLRFGLAPFAVGVPSHARKLLPDWIGIAPSLEDIPPKSVALTDEAYIHYHARRSMAQDNMSMSRLLNLSRQREQTLIFVSQEARQVDRNISSSANVVVFKDLGILQLEFDRPELRRLTTEASEMFSKVSGDKRRWAYVYSPDADFIGMLENELANFWVPRLSRMFASSSGEVKTRRPDKMTVALKAEKAKGLQERGLSVRETATELGVSPATVINYLKGYPYRTGRT